MKHSLLLLGVVAALVIGAPAAYSQAVWMDVLPGNGVCDANDVITSSTTQVDVYLDTNGLSDEDTCTDGFNTMDIFGYDVIITSGGNGTVDMDNATWTNAVGAFTTNLNPAQQGGGSFSIGWYAPLGTTLAAGTYKVGTLNFAATGEPTLSFLSDPSPFPTGSPVTGFGTNCSVINGIPMDYPNTASLNHDFTEACGTSSGTPTNTTTWGAIKNLYR